MTVKELIEKLKEFPDYSMVVDYEYNMIRDVSEEYLDFEGTVVVIN